MRLEQYTSDAICRAMGLGAFVDPGWPRPALRLVLTPAFDPEVCVTLSGPAEAPRMSVASLTQMLWREAFPRELPTAHEAVRMPTGEFTVAGRLFAAALADSGTRGRVCVDGMQVECCLASPEGSLEQFTGHVVQPTVAALVTRYVWLGWVGCRRPAVRNALAACGRYVGAEYPAVADPETPPTTHLMVLGSPEDRAGLLAQLRGTSNPGPSINTSDASANQGVTDN